MRFILPVSFIVCVAATLFACKKPAVEKPNALTPHETHANEIIENMTLLTDVIMHVSDLESAKQAAPRIEAIGDHFQAIAEKLKPLDPPTGQLKAALDERMIAENSVMQKAMGELPGRFQQMGPEAAKVLQESLGKYFEKLDAAGKEFGRHFKVR